MPWIFPIPDVPCEVPEIRDLPRWAKKTQALVFYAVAKGFKKAMDAWVPSERYGEFQEYCEKYSLHCVPDVKFVKAESYDAYEKSVWGVHLTTTKTLAEPLDSPSSGEIHCFVSADAENAREAYRFGWYPVVVDGRVSYKSYHDTIEFWNRLGYPECCVGFFFEKNDWNEFNFPAEIRARSNGFDFRCNPFWKDVGGSYAYHMPCRFDCPETVKWIEKIRSSLAARDPVFAAEIERRLKLPVLSVREQKVFAFEGRVLEDGSLAYESFYRLWKPEEDDVSGLLESGNRIRLSSDGTLYAYRDGEPVWSRVPTSRPWAIESPFIAVFR